MEKKYTKNEIEQKLEDGLRQISEYWPALNIALQNGWGGQLKKSKLNQVIKGQNDYVPSRMNEQEQKIFFVKELKQYIYDYQVTNTDVEDFLIDYMSDNYHVELEDNSEKYIGKLVVDLFDSLNKSDDSVYNQILEFAKKYAQNAKNVIKQSQQANNSDDEEAQFEDINEEDEEYRQMEQKYFSQVKQQEVQEPQQQQQSQNEPEKIEEEKENDKKPLVDEDGFTVVTKKGKKK